MEAAQTSEIVACRIEINLSKNKLEEKRWLINFNEFISSITITFDEHFCALGPLKLFSGDLIKRSLSQPKFRLNYAIINRA